MCSQVLNFGVLVVADVVGNTKCSAAAEAREIGEAVTVPAAKLLEFGTRILRGRSVTGSGNAGEGLRERGGKGQRVVAGNLLSGASEIVGGIPVRLANSAGRSGARWLPSELPSQSEHIAPGVVLPSEAIAAAFEGCAHSLRRVLQDEIRQALVRAAISKFRARVRRPDCVFSDAAHSYAFFAALNLAVCVFPSRVAKIIAILAA